MLMIMITEQSLKSVYFTNTQKSRYFMNEIFFLPIKELINYTSRLTLLQKIVFQQM